MVRLTVAQYMDSRGMTRYELAKQTGIRYQIIDKYYKNKVVRYDSYVLNKMCEALNCDISDLIEYQKQES